MPFERQIEPSVAPSLADAFPFPLTPVGLSCPCLTPACKEQCVVSVREDFQPLVQPQEEGDLTDLGQPVRAQA